MRPDTSWKTALGQTLIGTLPSSCNGVWSVRIICATRDILLCKSVCCVPVNEWGMEMFTQTMHYATTLSQKSEASLHSWYIPVPHSWRKPWHLRIQHQSHVVFGGLFWQAFSFGNLPSKLDSHRANALGNSSGCSIITWDYAKRIGFSNLF